MVGHSWKTWPFWHHRLTPVDRENFHHAMSKPSGMILLWRGQPPNPPFTRDHNANAGYCIIVFWVSHSMRKTGPRRRKKLAENLQGSERMMIRTTIALGEQLLLSTSSTGQPYSSSLLILHSRSLTFLRRYVERDNISSWHANLARTSRLAVARWGYSKHQSPSRPSRRYAREWLLENCS